MDYAAALDRLHGLGSSLLFALDEPGELVESWSNDVWVRPESVLRVCWRGDLARLMKEAAVLDVMPDAVPHAHVIESGREGGLAWMLLKRLPGRRLDLIWLNLSKGAQDESMARQGEMLRELHQWSAPLEVVRALSTSAPDPDVDQIVGSEIVPRSIDHALIVLESLEAASLVSSELGRALRARVDELSEFDPALAPESHVVVHADAHFANYLYDGSGITALLDFEWVTCGPAELELTAICRHDPDLRRLASDGPVAAEEVRVLHWIGRGYPELPSRDHLTERFWLLELVHHVREFYAVGRSTPASTAESVRLLAGLSAGPRVRF